MIAVVAHTKRAKQAHQLMETVGAAYATVDDGTLGCEGNHRRAWQWMADHATGFAVVLEDDAVPVRQFGSQLAQALEVAPTPIVSLYLGRKRPPHFQTAVSRATEHADSVDASFIVSDYLMHAVGLAIRTELIGEMLEDTRHSIRPWDYAVGAFAQRIGEKVCYTWPSLIDHADQQTVTKHPDKQPRTPGRTAWKTGTRSSWTPEAVSL